jgi:N-acetyl-alpha-D-glucosaminyl L-malate synthase BshA
MKIIIIVFQFLPRWIGGTEIATQNIARHLAHNGNEVHIITSADEGLEKEKREDDFCIHRISYPKIKVLGYIIFWIRCFLLIKMIKPEIVHSQGVQMGVPAFLAKTFFGISYIVYCRGSDVYLPWKFKKIISKVVLNSADKVIALTEDMKEKLQINYKKNIVVLPNGIDLKKFEGFSKQGMRDNFKIGSDEKIITFVGSFKLVKGVKYLIEAFAIIFKRNSEVKLLLIGDGPERKNLKNMVETHNLTLSVDFMGNVANQKIPEYLSISDIFVLPSLSEGFPSVILEAMASGLPIIATRVGGLPEIIKEGENGFLVDPKNSNQIADKAVLFLENSRLREKISGNNKEKSKEYNWENIIEKLVKVYLEVINKNK